MFVCRCYRATRRTATAPLRRWCAKEKRNAAPPPPLSHNFALCVVCSLSSFLFTVQIFAFCIWARTLIWPCHNKIYKTLTHTHKVETKKIIYYIFFLLLKQYMPILCCTQTTHRTQCVI